MKITIYTVNDCKFSQAERDYLKSKNLDFQEKNLETNRDFLTEMLSISDNFAGTPVTKIEKEDGQVVVLKGFTKEEFDKALGFAVNAETAPMQEPQPEPAAVPQQNVETAPESLQEFPSPAPSFDSQPKQEAVASSVPPAQEVVQPTSVAPTLQNEDDEYLSEKDVTPVVDTTQAVESLSQDNISPPQQPLQPPQTDTETSPVVPPQQVAQPMPDHGVDPIEVGASSQNNQEEVLTQQQPQSPAPAQQTQQQQQAGNIDSVLKNLQNQVDKTTPSVN